MAKNILGLVLLYFLIIIIVQIIIVQKSVLIRVTFGPTILICHGLCNSGIPDERI